MNRELMLKLIFGTAFLFMMFLWSGGIYKYSEQQYNIRYNKITGEIQAFEEKEGWYSIYEK